MRLFDMDRDERRAYIDLIMHEMQFKISASMIEKNRRLKSDEIDKIICEGMEKIREQI